jgi:hypothetical protein
VCYTSAGAKREINNHEVKKANAAAEARRAAERYRDYNLHK